MGKPFPQQKEISHFYFHPLIVERKKVFTWPGKFMKRKKDHRQGGKKTNFEVFKKKRSYNRHIH